MRNTFKLIVLSILLLSGLSAATAPAYRGALRMPQSNGDSITIYMHGDENFHWLTNEAGETVELGADGNYHVVAPVTPEQAAARRMAAPVYQSRAQRAPKINMAPRGLIILANFRDVAFRPENTHEAMDSLMNATGYSVNNAFGSVRDYFIAQSDSQYMPVFDVVGPVTLDSARAYYGTNGADGYDKYTADFVIDACLKADSLGVDFTLYDNNHDNTVDFVYIIYAGEGEADGGPDESLWPQSWDLYSALYYKSSSRRNYLSTKSLTIDGKKIGAFAYSGELRGRTTTRNGIGTLCHEFSHVLGLPDYYDTQGSNTSNKLTPCKWSLMDYGNYLMDGNVPPSYSLFDKWILGWTQPQLLNSAENVHLAPGEGRYISSSGISTSAYSTSLKYIVENRQQQGWDQGLPAHGLLVWSIRYNDTNWNGNKPNNTANQPGITIVPAYGSTRITGSARDVFPGSDHVTSWTPWAAYPLTDISDADGIVSFRFMGGIEERVDSFSVSYETEGVVLVEGLDSAWYVLGDTAFTAVFMAAEGYQTLAEDNCLWEVTMNGQEIDCATLTDGMLTFSIPSGEITGNIVVTVYASEDVRSSFVQNGMPANVHKLLRGQQILIIRNGELYNLMGQPQH